MISRLVGSLVLAGAIAMGGAAASAQDLQKQTFKVVGTWSNLTNWQQNEQPFWTKTLPEASKGQITVNIQSLSELGLKGTEIVRLVKLGLFDFAHGLPIYTAEDATVEGIDIAGVAKTFDMARKTVDAYAPVLGAAFEKKYGARVLNYYTWPSQMFYCNSPIKGLADIKGKKVRVQGTSQGDPSASTRSPCEVQEGSRSGHLAGRSRRGARRHRRDHSLRRCGARPAARHGRLRHHRHHARLQGRLARGDEPRAQAAGWLLGVVHHRQPCHLGQAR